VHPCASVAKIQFLRAAPDSKPRFRPRITQINTDKTKRTHHTNSFVLIRAHPCDPWQKTNSFLFPARKAIPPKPILRRSRVRADKTRANLDHLIEFSLFHRPQNKMSLAQMLTTLTTLSSTKQNPTKCNADVEMPATESSQKSNPIAKLPSIKKARIPPTRTTPPRTPPRRTRSPASDSRLPNQIPTTAPIRASFPNDWKVRCLYEFKFIKKWTRKIRRCLGQ